MSEPVASSLNIQHDSKKRKRANKLPKLPSNARIQKRPLSHPAIPSPNRNATSQKIVYVSSKTPFMSAVTRVRSTLSALEKRRTQSIFAVAKQTGKRHDAVLAAAEMSVQRKDKGEKGEFVVVKGSGKCVEKVLGIAGFFQGNAEKEDVWVRLETGSMWVIDDVEVVEGGEDGMQEDGEEKDIPETRLRQVSVLEVKIGLR